MRDRIVHTVLAIVLLTQSVAVLAVAPTMSQQHHMTQSSLEADTSKPSAEMSHHGESNSCHQEVVSSVPDDPKHCCDTASCMISCASAASAICYSTSLDSDDTHVRFVVDVGHVIPHKALTDLFHPPRIS
jgi:hypothetical protein